PTRRSSDLEDKGFGFIYGDDHIERFFHVREIRGANLPNNGDIVTFEHGQGRKGPRARNVVIYKNAKNKNNVSRDDRETCAKCGKKMIPRMVTYRGQAEKSLCPFCGATHRTFGNKIIELIIFLVALIIISSIFMSR